MSVRGSEGDFGVEYCADESAVFEGFGDAWELGGVGIIGDSGAGEKAPIY